jgi:hypothetical protein
VGQALISDLLIPNLKFIDLKSKIEDIDVLFVFGAPDGSLHRSLSTWLKKEDGRFLVFIEEQEELFLRTKDLPLKADPKVRLFYWKRGDEEIFQQIAWEFVFLRFGYVFPEPQLRQAAQDFFITLEHYHRGVDLLASDSEDMGVKVLKNAMKNLSVLPKVRLGSSLEGKCSQIPAIVCGAGPTLDLAAPLLAKMRDRALIIAGGSSVRALNAHGISPHIFANIDPHPPYRRFLEQDCFEVPFFYQSRFCYSLLERVQGPLILMSDSGSYPLEGWLSAEVGIFAERFDGGWTVANFCTSIAAHLGCNPIIFLGMDFSCGPDEIYASKIAGNENREFLVELEKDKLYSKRDWLMSAEWTVSFAKRNPSIHWINASTGGIDLPEIERRDLSEVAASILETEFDMSGIVHSLVSHAGASQVTSEKVDNVRKKVKESFEKCLEICDRLLKVWEKHYPNSPLEKGEYAILEIELEQEICHRHFLLSLWNVWKRPILRSSFHPFGAHIHRLLFFKKAIEMHLPYLRSLS